MSRIVYLSSLSPLSMLENAAFLFKKTHTHTHTLKGNNDLLLTLKVREKNQSAWCPNISFWDLSPSPSPFSLQNQELFCFVVDGGRKKHLRWRSLFFFLLAVVRAYPNHWKAMCYLTLCLCTVELKSSVLT